MADFNDIYKRYFRDVYHYAFSLCKNESMAEEITQETFFKALSSLESFYGKCKVSVWLCQIAKNTYFAWYNENKKLLPLDESQILDDSPDVADLFSEKEFSEKALMCLHQLEEPYKEVFMLAVLGNLSLKDISRLFGKSESWARVTYYRAKQKLIERMR